MIYRVHCIPEFLYFFPLLSLSVSSYKHASLHGITVTHTEEQISLARPLNRPRSLPITLFEGPSWRMYGPTDGRANERTNERTNHHSLLPVATYQMSRRSRRPSAGSIKFALPALRTQGYQGILCIVCVYVSQLPFHALAWIDREPCTGPPETVRYSRQKR